MADQNDKCPDCDGTGEVSPFEPYPDAKYPCPTCKGTGEKDRWHIIWDMCSEFITDPADCNELSTNIDALIEPLIKDAREQERERILKELQALPSEHSQTFAIAVAEWINKQALKEEQ